MVIGAAGRFRYALGTEPQFRWLITELSARFGSDRILKLPFKRGNAEHTFKLHANHFSFEDHRDDRQIDCRVCETVRDRRFALYVTCTDGEVRGPIGSSCLFVHVLSRSESQDIARRLEQIARDTVHMEDHARLQEVHRSHPLYLRALDLEWCMNADALERAGLHAATRARLAQWHRTPLAPLPRTLYEALRAAHDRGSAVYNLQNRQAPKRPVAVSVELPVPGEQKAHVIPRNQKLEPLTPEHQALITEYWPMIRQKFTNNRRADLHANLLSGRIQIKEIPAMVDAIREAQAEIEPLEAFGERFPPHVLEPWWSRDEAVALYDELDEGPLHTRLIGSRELRRTMRRSIDFAVSDALASGIPQDLADATLLGPSRLLEETQHATLTTMLTVDPKWPPRFLRPLRWQLSQRDVSDAIRRVLMNMHTEWKAEWQQAWQEGRQADVQRIFVAMLNTYNAARVEPRTTSEMNDALWKINKKAFIESMVFNRRFLTLPAEASPSSRETGI